MELPQYVDEARNALDTWKHGRNMRRLSPSELEQYRALINDYDGTLQQAAREAGETSAR